VMGPLTRTGVVEECLVRTNKRGPFPDKIRHRERDSFACQAAEWFRHCLVV